MVEPNDRQFDVVLEAFFRDALDGQRGRAERAFREQLVAPAPRARNGWKRNVWMIGSFGFGAAVAASVAVLWASPLLRAPDVTRQPVAEAASPALIPPTMEQVVQSQMVDEGTMFLADHTPVHVYRRHRLEQTRLFDRNEKVKAEQIVPEDDVVFVKLTTY